jgi:hypothetical protein
MTGYAGHVRERPSEEGEMPGIAMVSAKRRPDSGHKFAEPGVAFVHSSG